MSDIYLLLTHATIDVMLCCFCNADILLFYFVIDDIISIDDMYHLYIICCYEKHLK